MPIRENTRRPGTDSTTVIPVAVVLCSAAAVVLTAHRLGAFWLSAGLLGLPLGVWIIAAVFVLWRRGWLAKIEAAIPFSARHHWLDLNTVTHRRFAPFLRLWLALHAAARSCRKPAHISLHQLQKNIAARLDAAPELAEPIHIAIVAPRAVAEALRDQNPAVPVRWRLLDTFDRRDRDLFDLVFLADEIQGGVATTAEHEHQPATWFDWAQPRPLSFASVFPHQNDPAQISVGVLPNADDPNPLVGALLVAAAVQARTPSRLNILDRLRGRIPLDGPDHPHIIDPGAFRARAMRRLAELLHATDPAHATVIERTAASVVSAWLVAPAARIDIAQRRELIENVHPFLQNSPEAWLRLAAVRIADYDDAAGIQALLHADPLVRNAREQLVLDQAAFVQSELSHDDGSSMTVGRVAAGFCLVSAQHAYEKLPFLKEDLLEDLEHAGWLIGRDHDAALLREVLEHLVRVRRSESRGLPAVHPPIAA